MVRPALIRIAACCVMLLAPAAAEAQALPLDVPAGRPVYRPPTSDKPIEEIDLDALARRCEELCRSLAPTKPVDRAAQPVDVADTPAWRLLQRMSDGSMPVSFAADFARYAAANGAVDAGLARYLTTQALCAQMLGETWADDVPYHPALVPADPRHLAMKAGRFTWRHSDVRQHRWLTSGAGLAALSALGLHLVDAFPQVHAEYQQRVAPDDAVIPFHDTPPRLDGSPDQNLYHEVTGHVMFAADPSALYIFIDRTRDQRCTILIHDGATPTTGSRLCRIQILAAESRVTNHEGRPVICYPKYGDTGTELQIPWAGHKDQADWMIAAEHARGRVSVDIQDGEQLERGFYLLSPPGRMSQRLFATVEAVIVQYAHLIEKHGHIPAQLTDAGEPIDSAGGAGFDTYRDLLAAIDWYRQHQRGERAWR